jgi:hypothetical protein
MNETTATSRILGLALAVGIAALSVACNGLPAPGENADPAVVALTSPDLPVAPLTPADPGLPGAASTGAGPAQPWQSLLIPRDVVVPYPDAVRAMIAEKIAAEGPHNHRNATASVVYLNFEGQAITYSNNGDDSFYNESFIPGHNVTVPAFNASHWGSNRQSVINTIVADLQQVYAGYNVTFTKTRPSSGNYMMTVIGGSAALIGMQQGVLGVSPMDCGNDWARDVNFICTEDIAAFNMSLWSLVYTIAHENAHTYGLAHINRQGDIMYWAEDGSGSLTLGAATTKSGESNCSTNNYQDDKVFLTANVGGGGTNPETTPPTVAITSPANGSSQSSSFKATVTATDASSITTVELWKDGVLFDSLWLAPYEFTILPQAAGSHTLQAKAADPYGNIGSSATVTFVVPGTTPTGCTTDAQCASNQKCQGGTCVDKPPAPTGGALGANCSRNEDCLSTWCIFGEQNYCTQQCNEAQNQFCPVGYYCSADGFCLSSTPIPPGATGSPCSQNAECRSTICVDGANNGFCTSVCQQNGNPCPNGSKCVNSGDGQTYICDRPPTTTHGDGGTSEVGGSGGCAAAPAGPGAGLGALGLLLLLGVTRRRGAGR